MRGQAGQASLEYAGLLVVVATVLVVVAGVAGGGAITNGVARGFERALCRVTGSDCLAAELSACTVRSKETGGKLGVELTFVKLGGSLALLREELSDGTVDVTLIDGADVAPTAAFGASGGVRLGGARLGGGAITQAELLVRLGRRRVWRRPDAASADRLVRDVRAVVALRLGTAPVPFGDRVLDLAGRLGLDVPKLPAPDVSAISAGVEGVVEAELGGTGRVRAGLKASLGGSRDRRTGRRTLVLALEGDAAATLIAAAGGAGLSGSSGVTVTLTYDRAGEPVELAVGVAGAGRADLGLDLPKRKGKDGGAGRVEITSRLDLGRPANRVVYERLLDALAPGGDRALPAAAVALAHQVAVASRRDVQRFATDVDAYGADAEAAVGAGVGGSVEVSRTRSELLDAWTRPAGGAWEQRTECLGGGERA